MIISETIGGGVRKHLLLLLHHLDLSNFSEVILIHGNRYDEIFKEDISQLKEKGIKVVNIPSLVRSLNPREDMKAYRQISKIIKEEHPDIVHCHSSKAGIIGRAAAKRRGVKKVFYTPHGYSFQADEFSSLKRRLFTFIEREASRHATTMTFTVSEGEKQLAIDKEIDCPCKFDVIYNGLPDIQIKKGKLRSFLGLNEEDMVIGNCARISAQKNVDLFIDIAQSYLRFHPKAHFIWIGDGENIEKYNMLHPNIHFIGFRSDSEELVTDFNVFLTTSLYEGLPYASVEALRASVPVVASDVVGNNDIVIPGVNGFLYPLNDVDSAIKAIEKTKLINKEDIKHDFEQRFSLDKMIEKIEGYYLC